MEALRLAHAILDATATQDANGARLAALREALAARFRELHERDGIRATIDIPDVGRARWDTPEPEPYVTDEVALFEWQTQKAPSLRQVTFTVSAKDLVAALAVLDANGIRYSADWTIRDSDRAAVLAKLRATDEWQAVTPDGEIVPGVVFRDRPAKLVVTPDATRKADIRRAAKTAVEAELSPTDTKEN